MMCYSELYVAGAELASLHSLATTVPAQASVLRTRKEQPALKYLYACHSCAHLMRLMSSLNAQSFCACALYRPIAAWRRLARRHKLATLSSARRHSAEKNELGRYTAIGMTTCFRSIHWHARILRADNWKLVHHTLLDFYIRLQHVGRSITNKTFVTYDCIYIE